MSIEGFFKEYRFLSNFWPAKTLYDGEIYPTSEHAYQASKTLNLEEREIIRNAKTPEESKKMGKSIRIRKDFDRIKINLMRSIVFSKFMNNKELRKKLLKTGEEILVEKNHWNDKFWGECNGEGKNNLGKILMSVREKIKSLKEE
jgi:ribA/ribD-fused uncharacterized protein